MATIKEYDAYTDIFNYSYALEKAKKGLEIYIQTFGLSKSHNIQKAFQKLLRTIIILQSYDAQTLLNDVKTTFKGQENGFTILKISQEYKEVPKNLPDVIFQGRNEDDFLLITDKENETTAQRVYDKKDANTCAVCGRSLKGNSFVYYKDGKYYGKSCFENSIMTSSQIKFWLRRLHLIQEIMVIVGTSKFSDDSYVMSFDENTLSDKYSVKEIEQSAETILANNSIVTSEFKNPNDVRKIAQLIAQKMFLVNFISIPPKEKFDVKKILDKNEWNFKDFMKYLYPKTTDLGYIKRYSLNGNLTIFYNTYNLVVNNYFNKDAETLNELKNLNQRLKSISSDDLTQYTEILTKISPLLNEGVINSKSENAKWYVGSNNKSKEGFTLEDEVELGTNHFFIFKRK